ncbi:MAG: fumarylacetoacetate hydrolase family protein [Rhodospirillales bacterium]|nr:fumarylacetoacetate hydrolase family protein [Rhodospirillales bacterium]
MTPAEIEAAARLLVAARRGGPALETLPVAPASIAEAHAIQDTTARLLGDPVGGFKAAAVGNDAPTRGLIYARTIHASPARIPAREVALCGVEGEVAFRFTRDLPARAAPYAREEVAAVLEACAAIEVIHSRYADQANRTMLEKLADCVSNGAFVHAAPVADWRGLDLEHIHVQLEVNGETVLDQNGGNPSGDPVKVATALANMMRDGSGVRAGQFVTCGTFTGLRFLKPGDRCVARFAGLGTAEVIFVA